MIRRKEEKLHNICKKNFFTCVVNKKNLNKIDQKKNNKNILFQTCKSSKFREQQKQNKTEKKKA